MYGNIKDLSNLKSGHTTGRSGRGGARRGGRARQGMGRSGSNTNLSLCSRTYLAWKGFTETNRRRYTGQQPATKSARGLGEKQRINRWINRLSTADFVCPSVYIGFPLFVLAKRRSEQLFTVRWRAWGAVGFQGDRNVGTLFCPASRRPAVCPSPCRSDPPVVCSGFGLDGFFSVSRIMSWTSLRKHEQYNSYLKTTKEQNPRFTTGTRSALLFWLLTSVPTPFCLCKSLHVMHVWELEKLQSHGFLPYTRLQHRVRVADTDALRSQTADTSSPTGNNMIW